MNRTFWTNKYTIILLAFLCCALWGSAAPFIKFGYEQFAIDQNQTGQILLFAGMRFAIAGLIVILIGSIVSKQLLMPTRKDWIPILILAFFQTSGQYFFYYLGVAHTSGVSAAVITGAGAFISLLVAALIFHYEKMTLSKTIGCLLGFFGIWILNGFQMGLSFTFFGEGLVLVSQFFSAFSAAFIKKFSQDRNAMMLSGYQFFIGGILLCVSGKGIAPTAMLSWNAKGGMILVYLAFVSAIAYSLWSYLLKFNRVSKIGMYQCWIPITGVLWSAVLLKEGSQAFSVSTLIALILVMIGIQCVNKEDYIKT